MSIPISAFSWRGRIGRLRFAAYVLHQATWVAVLTVCTVGITVDPGTLAYATVEWVMRIAVLAWLAGIGALWCGAIKRCHDMDMRGWWSLSLLIAAPLVLLFLLLVPGSKGENRFGPAS